MKVIFMGTPDFAVPTLEKLIENHDVLLVITQPDKPKGRGKKIMFPPVKEKAIIYNIPVLQPMKVREQQYIEQIRAYEPEVIVVEAFGQILPKEILDIPKYGCINVHASLLPKYRGAGPIQWSIINGETVTGITTMFMGEAIDTGDMLLKSDINIDVDDTYGSLHDKMSLVGADLLIETLKKLELGTLTRIKQNDKDSTYAPILKKEIGHIDWNKSSTSIINLIRGLNPWPSAYTYYESEILKIWKAQVFEECCSSAKSGEIIEILKDKGIIIKTGDGALIILEIQSQGGKKMSVIDYMRGHHIEVGKTLV